MGPAIVERKYPENNGCMAARVDKNWHMNPTYFADDGRAGRAGYAYEIRGAVHVLPVHRRNKLCACLFHAIQNSRHHFRFT